MTAPEAPAKGHQNTAHDRRPVRGVASSLLLWFKSPRAQVGGFSEGSLTQTRLSKCHPGDCPAYSSSSSPAERFEHMILMRGEKAMRFRTRRTSMMCVANARFRPVFKKPE